MSEEFKRLKAWRKGLAEEVGVQIYKWLSDKVLEAIVEAAPKTPDDLRNIKGLGPTSVKKYGPEILEIFGAEEEDGVHVPGSGEVKWKKDTPIDLPEGPRPFVDYEDRFFSPGRQLKLAADRKQENERPKSLEETLKKELTFKDGFQIGPLMRKAVCELRPKTIADLEAMDFNHTDMNPLVIERYGKRILSIVARFEAFSAIIAVPSRPETITTARDLLILSEKRNEAAAEERSGEDLCPNFSVCGRTAGLDSPKYELILEVALSFIDSCLYLEDAEGKLLPKSTVAGRLKAIGVPMPSGFEEFQYLADQSVPSQSYWIDADKYEHLTRLRHRVREDE